MNLNTSTPVAFFESEQPYVKGRQLGFAMTSKEPNACVECTVTCEDQWSMIQMQATAMMTEGGEFISHAMRRAERTAGNYAQLFLDDEGTANAGRFYWAGLAAFAAKQVVDGMKTARQFLLWRPQSASELVRFSAAVTYYYLAKGNLWVFLEVVPWHLFYRQYGPACFQHCCERRDVDTYDAPVKKMIKKQPWASGPNEGMLQVMDMAVPIANFKHPIGSRPLNDGAALAEINNCRMTEPLRRAFAYIRDYETKTEKNIKGLAAYNAAWASLEHEQKLHLQRMLYDHPEFKNALDMNDRARCFPNLAWLTGATDPTLFFHADAQVDEKTYQRDVEPYDITMEEITAKMELKDGALFDVDARMRYVEVILQKYHKLMTATSAVNGKPPHRDYMVGQMKIIAERWRNA
jgi:hypothetical protein